MQIYCSIPHWFSAPRTIVSTQFGIVKGKIPSIITNDPQWSRKSTRILKESGASAETVPDLFMQRGRKMGVGGGGREGKTCKCKWRRWRRYSLYIQPGWPQMGSTQVARVNRVAVLQRHVGAPLDTLSLTRLEHSIMIWLQFRVNSFDISPSYHSQSLVSSSSPTAKCRWSVRNVAIVFCLFVCLFFGRVQSTNLLGVHRIFFYLSNYSFIYFVLLRFHFTGFWFGWHFKDWNCCCLDIYSPNMCK